MSCQQCLHQKPVPQRNSVQPSQPYVASRSCCSHGPVWMCVIVTGSITTLKYDNIICNNKIKLAECHCALCTLTILGVERKRATQTTHTEEQVLHIKHVSTASLQFVSQTQACSDFRPCGFPKIYRSTHQAVCHYCLQESDLWGFLGRRGNSDMVWMSMRMRNWEEVKLPLNNHQKWY